MDFKALRAKRNDKARSLIESSGGKVDSSTWTPDEMLDADVKTGMRPISRRAFKAGGKVEGEEAKGNLSRAPRGGFKETVGLANTNQKDANEDREGVKHVGGFKKGGRIGKMGGGWFNDPNYRKAKPAQLDAVGPDESGEGSEPMPSMSGRPSKAEMDRGQAALDAQIRADKANEGRQALRDMGDMTRRKNGGKAEKYEGSPKDNLTDAKMAKKKGMTHAEWEKSPEDKRMDAKGQREMDQRTKKAGGGGMDDDNKHPFYGDTRGKEWDEGKEKWVKKKTAPAGTGRKDIPQYPSKQQSPRHEDDPRGGDDDYKRGGAAHDKGCSCKACGGRMGRATGGRTKGTTNISINVMPHTPNKQMGIQPPMPMPMPPVGGPPPMGAMPPPRMSLPPGLGAAMAGAAGASPMPPQGAGPMPPPMMGRKSGGKVYPKMKFGAGSGEGRLEKIEKYGKNA